MSRRNFWFSSILSSTFFAIEMLIIFCVTCTSINSFLSKKSSINESNTERASKWFMEMEYVQIDMNQLSVSYKLSFNTRFNELTNIYVHSSRFFSADWDISTHFSIGKSKTVNYFSKRDLISCPNNPITSANKLFQII